MSKSVNADLFLTLITTAFPLPSILLGLSFGTSLLCIGLFMRLERRPFLAWINFIATLTCILCYQVTRAVDIYIFALFTKRLVYSVQNPIDDAATGIPPGPNLLANAAAFVPQLIIGGSIVHTAVVLYPRNRSVSWPLYLLLVGMCACGLYLMIPVDNIQYRHIPDERTLAYNRINWSFYLISFLVNFLSTTLVGIKLYRHRAITRLLLGKSQQMTRSIERILLVFIESGVVYLFFQLVILVLSSVMGGAVAQWGPTTLSSAITYGTVLVSASELAALYPGIHFCLLRYQALRDDSPTIFDVLSTSHSTSKVVGL